MGRVEGQSIEGPLVIAATGNVDDGCSGRGQEFSGESSESALPCDEEAPVVKGTFDPGAWPATQLLWHRNGQPQCGNDLPGDWVFRELDQGVGHGLFFLLGIGAVFFHG